MNNRKQLIAATDMAGLQGFSRSDRERYKLDKLDDHAVADMAGNAFSTSVAICALMIGMALSAELDRASSNK